jgi:two-component system sensor histidine kinase DesK
MSFRLLPRDRFSWTAYIWLVYLGSPIWSLFAGRPPGAPSGIDIATTCVGIAVFLPFYFWGYWLQGPRSLLPIAAITAIAVLLSPMNAGGYVFFVYAAAFAGRVGRPARGVLVLIALLAVVGTETWLVGLGPEVWGPAAPLTIFIGGLNVVFMEIGRTQISLRAEAEAETQRLAVVAERERIGRDLHDLLGHTLSVITLKADLASKLATRDLPRAIAEVRDIERISRDALAEVRQTVQGYRASGLTDELRHARAALEAAGIALECRVADIALQPISEQTLALALREAVTNVVRHATARRCRIQLEAVDGRARLEIKDDGIGGGAPDGFGLLGMRARVAALSGQVERHGDDGTRLVIVLPLETAT